jgi:hypothetical protein
MLRLHVVQAEFGDALILEFGTTSKPRFILIDGGPSGVYKNYLRDPLVKIQQAGGCLDLAVLSHIDNDHIIGMLDLMAEILDDRASGKPDLISIAGVWHNSFDKTIGEGTSAAERLGTAFSFNPAAFGPSSAAGSVAFGINEGNQLHLAHENLNIPINAGFSGGIITIENVQNPVQVSSLKLWIVGPSRQNLENLKKDWQAWLEKFESRVQFADAIEADKIDRSVPNLSSIMFLAVSGKRKMLMTGDGLGSDLVSGLKQAGLLDAAGKLHVDVLKLPHHGSVRNVSRVFFDTITADTYVVSANGKYNNPDLATLIWLVEAAHRQGRKITIAATNPTDSTDQLQKEYPAEEYGYVLKLLPAGEKVMII